MIKIPEDEIKIKFIRSSGPGGQNVNRRATKVLVQAARMLTEEPPKFKFIGI